MSERHSLYCCCWPQVCIIYCILQSISFSPLTDRSQWKIPEEKSFHISDLSEHIRRNGDDLQPQDGGKNKNERLWTRRCRCIHTSMCVCVCVWVECVCIYIYIYYIVKKRAKLRWWLGQMAWFAEAPILATNREGPVIKKWKVFLLIFFCNRRKKKTSTEWFLNISTKKKKT